MLKVENMPPVKEEGERIQKTHITKSSFLGKKKSDNFKTYCTQFMAPVVTLSYLEEGGGVVTLKSLHT